MNDRATGRTWRWAAGVAVVVLLSFLGVQAWRSARPPARAKPALDPPTVAAAPEDDRFLPTSLQPPPPGAPIASADPLDVAFPADSPTAVVLRWSAFRNGALGSRLSECFALEPMLPSFEAEGIDVDRHVDRIAIASDVIVVTGRFGRARFDLYGRESSRYGRESLLFHDPDGARPVGLWRSDVVVIGRGDAIDAVAAALDRLEGRSPPGRLPRGAHRGELYGVVPAELFASDVLSGTDAEDAFRTAFTRVELSVEAMDDLRIRIVAVGDHPERSAEAVDVLQRSLPDVRYTPTGFEPFLPLLKKLRATAHGAQLTLEATLSADDALEVVCRESEAARCDEVIGEVCIQRGQP